MKEEMTEFSSTWGQLLLVYIKPVVKFFNGLLLTLNAIGRAIMKNKEEVDKIDYDKEFAGLEKGAFDAEESVNKLNKSINQLYGLDQLNVAGDSSSISNNFDIGVDEKILNAVNEYQANLDNISFKAQEISDNILKWLGFTKDETGEINNLDKNLERLKENIFTIVGIIGTITITKEMPKLVTQVKTLQDSLTSMGGIKGLNGLFGKELIGGIKGIGTLLETSILSPIGLIIGAISLITAGIIAIFASGSDKSKEWKAELKNTWENILKPALDNIWRFVQDLFKILKVIFEKVIIPISAIVGDLLFNVIIPLVSEILLFVSQILPLVMAIIKPIVEILAPVLQLILGVIEVIFNYIGKGLNVVIKLIHFILSGISLLINAMIDGINFVIRGINKLSWKMPDWLGGYTWGFNIKELSRMEIGFPELPEFANGNVATTPTLAEFGEYANARYNPEITAPQSILKETFIESMLPFVNAILRGDDEVIKAIKEQNLTLNINGREFAEATMNDFKSVATRKGYKNII